MNVLKQRIVDSQKASEECEKLVELWARQKIENIDRILKDHNQLVVNDEEIIKEQEMKYQELSKLIKKLEISQKNERDAEDRMKMEHQSLRQKENLLSLDLPNQEETINKLWNEVKELQSISKKRQSELEEQHQLLMMEAERHEKLLGLKFIKIAERNALQVRFVNIDPLEPCKVFSFLIRIQERYEILDVIPAGVPIETKVIEDLNKGIGTFGNFILEMRRTFKNFCNVIY